MDWGVCLDRSVSYSYGLVMDAGSVHTTATVYRWPTDRSDTNGTGDVREVFSCEGSSESGITSYSDRPEEVDKALRAGRCLDKAVGRIPESRRADSVLFLGATAGMRVLNATDHEKAAELMENTRSSLEEMGFLKGNGTESSARILSSSEEGILGWITANSLNGTLDPASNNDASTVGALDWGGASSQITFEMPPQDGNNNGLLSTVKKSMVTLYGRNHSLFTVSHMCYGQKEALRRYFVELIHQEYKRRGGVLPKYVKAPCQPKIRFPTYGDGGENSPHHHSMKASELFFSACTRRTDTQFQLLAESDPDRVFYFVGQSNHARCAREVRKAFDPARCRSTYVKKHCFDSDDVPLRLLSEESPSSSSSPDFVAFSTYWYLISALGIPGGRVSQFNFRHSVSRLCGASDEFAHGLLGKLGGEVERNTCFRGVFMQHLLKDGYKFLEWTGIDFAKRVAHAEVGWTLGYMVNRTNSLPSETEKEDQGCEFLGMHYALWLFVAVVVVVKLLGDIVTELLWWLIKMLFKLLWSLVAKVCAAALKFM